MAPRQSRIHAALWASVSVGVPFAAVIAWRWVRNRDVSDLLSVESFAVLTLCAMLVYTIRRKRDARSPQDRRT